ncbi:hypothetical protein C8R45DRAFT_945065 [Mycena sanguinolenta]|nr:hypothetical protein C8R45DRAFT_945065 [Mycena sanguinolenta]
MDCIFRTLLVNSRIGTPVVSVIVSPLVSVRLPNVQGSRISIEKLEVAGGRGGNGGNGSSGIGGGGGTGGGPTLMAGASIGQLVINMSGPALFAGPHRGILLHDVAEEILVRGFDFKLEVSHVIPRVANKAHCL